MPFTPVHIAAVIPVAMASGRLPLAALAIGSMLPDLAYFVPFGPGYGTLHSVPGVFGVCLPLGMGFFLLFHWMLKVPLLGLMPVWFQRRLAATVTRRVAPTVGYLAGVATAVLLGAATHLVWDSFTHADRWGTQLFPSLNHTLSVWGRELPWYKLFQYGSSLIGLPLLVICAAVWLVRQVPQFDPGPPDAGVKTKLTALAVSLFVPIVAATLAYLNGAVTWPVWVGLTIRYTGQAILVAICLYTIVFHWVTDARYLS